MSQKCHVILYGTFTLADKDLELKGVGGGGSFVLLVSAFIPVVISSFLPKKGGPGPPGPPSLDPATDSQSMRLRWQDVGQVVCLRVTRPRSSQG